VLVLISVFSSFGAGCSDFGSAPGFLLVSAERAPRDFCFSVSFSLGSLQFSAFYAFLSSSRISCLADPRLFCSNFLLAVEAGIVIELSDKKVKIS
jgi:hypothetical protein